MNPIRITINDILSEGITAIEAVCEVDDYDVDEQGVSYTITWCEIIRSDDTCVELDEDDLFAILSLQDQFQLERALLEEITYGIG